MSSDANPSDSGAVASVEALTLGDDAGGSSGDARASGATAPADGADGSPPAGAKAPPTPKPLTEEQRAKILTQVEFYFSDANLPTDAFLMKRVRADPEGWVPLGVICGFNRMKQLLKKHPHTVVADILAEKSTLLIVDDARAKLRRAQPLPDFDLEDVQSRTVVAENFGADTPTIDGVRERFAPAGEVLMVRVRHPGMQTPAGATSKSGLDLVHVASGAVHALVEFATRDAAARSVEMLNDDKDWRNGLRVRLLVKNLGKKKKQREQREAAAAAAAAGEGATEGTEGGAAEGAEGGEEAAGDGAGEGASPAKSKKGKGKYGRQKRDYSQWASAAAFKENKTFLEGPDAIVGGEGEAAAGATAAAGAGGEGDHPSTTTTTTTTAAKSAASAPAPEFAAPRQPTMPDGTRGFGANGSGRGKRVPPPGIPLVPRTPVDAATETEE